jgi:hypothetical protein
MTIRTESGTPRSHAMPYFIVTSMRRLRSSPRYRRLRRRHPRRGRYS